MDTLTHVFFAIYVILRPCLDVLIPATGRTARPQESASVINEITGSAFRLYAEVSGDFGRGLIGSIETGFAISNSSTAPATVTLELRRLDGSPTGLTATVQVPANGQVSKFVYQIRSTP